jgi:sterol-4alpha-carboxylate 3-dehydrogenase (decarboxylating)
MAPVPATTKPTLGNVLVIGGCGFLGHHIVSHLISNYTCKTSALDLRTTRNRLDGASYYDGDITSISSLLAIFAKLKPAVVIHTASPVGNAGISNEVLQKVNVDGTRAVVEACQQSGVKALVYTSSASVISNNVDDLINADERWPVLKGKAQTDYYSLTKVRC